VLLTSDINSVEMLRMHNVTDLIQVSVHRLG